MKNTKVLTVKTKTKPRWKGPLLMVTAKQQSPPINQSTKKTMRLKPSVSKKRLKKKTQKVKNKNKRMNMRETKPVKKEPKRQMKKEIHK